jgi:TolB-like protein/DNA-binding winged helix-turn-helix (wHTH) protein/Tfp pilus assembly protein PilF
MDRPSPTSACVRFGVFEVDLRSGELRKAGSRVALQEQPFRILVRLLERPGEVVTREQLRQELWPGDTFVDFDHGLNAAVKRLRDALGDSAETPRFIETLPRRGYRFIAPAEVAVRDAGAGLSRLPALRLWLLAATGGLVVTTLAVWFAGGVAVREASYRPIPSLAVLPLRNLSGDPGQDWFAEGMTEALSSTLSQIGALTVVSSTSTTLYKNHAKSAAEIAKELGDVDILLEGSILRNDHHVSVTIAAVDARTDRRRWTRTYERELGDVLSLYRDIALAAAREMSVALTPPEQARLATTPIVRPEAYEAHLRGSYLMTRWHEGGCYEAKRHFRMAIDLDPGFAPPYAALAFCLCWPVSTHQTATERAEARAAATLALQMDQNLAMGHVASAFVKMRFDYDWVGAEAGFKQALELDPGSALAHVYYAELLDAVGREQEAIDAMRHALRLNPFWIDHNVAFGYLLVRRGQYDAAIEHLRETLELDRNYQSALLWLGEAHAYKGEQDAAVAGYLEYLNRVLIPSRAAASTIQLERGYLTSGWPEFWRRELALAEEELLQAGSVWKESFARHCNAFFMARRYARLGQWDRALAKLEQAYEERSTWMPFVQGEALFEPLRHHRRYQELIRRMGLPPPAVTSPIPPPPTNAAIP